MNLVLQSAQPTTTIIKSNLNSLWMGNIMRFGKANELYLTQRTLLTLLTLTQCEQNLQLLSTQIDIFLFIYQLMNNRDNYFNQFQ
jgi:hypothetical protein